MDDWEHAPRHEREAKDEYFAEHPHSPLPPNEHDEFDGLRYYLPDPPYRFELALEEFNEKESFTVETTQDGEQTYLQWGKFRFKINGEKYALTASRIRARTTCGCRSAIRPAVKRPTARGATLTSKG